MNDTYIYGLIGFPLGHSFSKKYFSEKFEKEGLPHLYQLFELRSINELPSLLANTPRLRGLNVTIPYKKSVIPFLDEISPEAVTIGAVNVIKFQNGKLIGYNTDVYGFEKSFFENFYFEKQIPPKALILGTGGAAAAAAYVFKKRGIEYMTVSRNKDTFKPNLISYKDLNVNILSEHTLIVNATPLGMYPNIDTCPNLRWDEIGPNHFLFDMVYNPEETLFLKKGKARGAHTKNGLEMLHLQAEKSFIIMNYEL